MMNEQIDIIRWNHLGKSKADIIISIRLPEYCYSYIKYVQNYVNKKLAGCVNSLVIEFVKGDELVEIRDIT